MAAGEQSGPEHQLVELASIIEGAMFVADQLHDADMPSLAEMHLGAARDMVENSTFADMGIAAAGDAIDERTPRMLRRRTVAYGLTMLAIERAVDERHPTMQPPLSESIRAHARERYGDRVDEQLAALPPFPLG